MTLYQKLILRGGLFLLLVWVAAGAWSGTKLPGFSVEAGTDVLLNQKDPDLAFYNDSRADWGTDEYVMVCCHRNEGWFTPDGMAIVNDFVHLLEKQPYAKSIWAVTNLPLLRMKPPMMGMPIPAFIVGKDGKIDAKVDLEKARAEFVAHTQAKGNLISDDAKDLSILVYLDVPDEIVKYEAERNRAMARMKSDPAAAAKFREVDVPYQAGVQEQNRRRLLLVNGIRDLAKEWRPKFDEPVRLSGLPLINVVLREHIKTDIATFGIVAFAVFSLTFLAIYRRLRWMVLPILSCVLPVVVMLGIMVTTGRKVTVITSNMPVLLFVLTLPYAVYYIERYLERRAADPGEDPIVSSTRAPLEIWSPCLYSVLATMVGTAAHIPSGINPVSVFGVMMTIGMAISLAVIMLFLPSAVVRLPGVPAANRGATAEPGGPLKLLLTLVLRAPKAVMAFSLVVLGLSLWGTYHIKVETKFIDYFRTKSEIYQGLDYIDNRMGGTTPLEVILRSDTPGFFKKPEGLAALAAVGRFFDASNVPEIGNVRSLKTLVDEGRKAFTNKEGKVLTGDPQIVNAAIAMVPGLVREFCNADFTKSRVLIRMKETAPTLNRNRILARLQEHLDGLKGAELQDVEARKTGVFLLYANMLNTLIINTKETFLLAVGGIWLMLLVLFRSPILATIVLLPQVLPVFLVLGVMGFTGIALDMVTVIIASVAMGVGIDAAIQYTVRFKSELAKSGGDIPAAIRRSHATIGRAILIATSIVFAGFVMLSFSQFIPTVYFGVFTGLAILMGLFASLTTLPSAFLLLKYPRLKHGEKTPEH